MLIYLPQKSVAKAWGDAAITLTNLYVSLPEKLIWRQGNEGGGAAYGRSLKNVHGHATHFRIILKMELIKYYCFQLNVYH